MKAIPNRKWNDAEKAWYVPAEHHEQLKKIVDSLGGAGSTGAIGGGYTQTVTLVQRGAAHEALKLLAAMDDDRATVRNAAGFSQSDGDFGHKLAESLSLSDAQYRIARVMVSKYRRQLPADLVDRALGNVTPGAQPPFTTKSRPTMVMVLDKGRKALPIGTIRTYDNVPFRKTETGWVYAGKGVTKGAAHEESGKLKLSGQRILQNKTFPHKKGDAVENNGKYGKILEIDKEDQSAYVQFQEGYRMHIGLEDLKIQSGYVKGNITRSIKKKMGKARDTFPRQPYPDGAIRPHGKQMKKKVKGLWVPVKEGKTEEERRAEAKEKKGTKPGPTVDGDPHILQHLEEIASGASNDDGRIQNISARMLMAAQRGK